MKTLKRWVRRLAWVGLAVAGLAAVNWAGDRVKYPGPRFYDVAYGDFERNKMDIFLPDKIADKANLGAILVIHGGAWTGGDKFSERALCKEYAKKGYVTATMSYHYVTPETSTDDDMQDIALATARLKSFAEAKGLTIKHLALHGTSSGAHLAMLFAYSRPQNSAIPLAFVVDLVGPCDFHAATWQSKYGPVFGPLAACRLYGQAKLQEYWGAADADLAKLPADKLEAIVERKSPLHYVNAQSAPTICGYASHNSIVPSEHAAAIKAALEKYGVPHAYHLFNADHPLWGDEATKAALYRDVDNYCRQYFGY